MGMGLLTTQVDVWITQYIAGFCLVSILVWGMLMYAWSKQGKDALRDAGIYLVSIGTLTLVLAMRPQQHEMLLWTSVTWFAFSMLMILELLWISFLGLSLVRLITSLPERVAEEQDPWRLRHTGKVIPAHGPKRR
jgi:uncharacterized membrane protein